MIQFQSRACSMKEKAEMSFASSSKLLLPFSTLQFYISQQL